MQKLQHTNGPWWYYVERRDELCLDLSCQPHGDDKTHELNKQDTICSLGTYRGVGRWIAELKKQAIAIIF